jgi:acid phosphatase class B
MEAFGNDRQQVKKILYIKENKIFEFLKTIIIGYNVQDTILFDTCYIQEEKETIKKNKESFKELIKKF